MKIGAIDQESEGQGPREIKAVDCPGADGKIRVSGFLFAILGLLCQCTCGIIQAKSDGSILRVNFAFVAADFVGSRTLKYFFPHL